MPATFPARAFLLWSLLLAALPGLRARSDDDDAKASPVINLPVYTVTADRDLPPPEAWRYAEIPGFEILSNASDRTTQNLLKDFQEFNQAIGVVWPAILGRHPLPVSLILCGRGGKFDAFLPKNSDAGPTQGTASLFFLNAEHSAIVVDLEAQEISLAELEGAGGVANNGRIEVDAYRQLYREYVHALIARINPRPAAWLEEGLAQLLMGIKFDNHSIQFAQLEYPDTVSNAQATAARNNADATRADLTDLPETTAAAEDRDFNASLNHRALLPLQEMFDVAHDSAVARNAIGSVWAKQSCAFVHMCLYATGQRHQKGFLRFVERSAHEPVTEAMFKECFGIGYKAMQLQLRGYVNSASYKSIQWIAKNGTLPIPAPLALRDATEAEVGRIKGEALILAGQTDAARNTLVAAYRRGERDPQLLAALGIYERGAGNTDRAQKFLEAAAAAHVVRPLAYLELARLRYSAALSHPAGAEGTFSADQQAAITGPLLIARTQPPAMPEVYELIADATVRGGAAPTPDTLGILTEGVKLFPLRLGLIYQTAVLCQRAGDLKSARALIEHGLRYAQPGAAQSRFAELKATLPTKPAAPPAAKS